MAPWLSSGAPLRARGGTRRAEPWASSPYRRPREGTVQPGNSPPTRPDNKPAPPTNQSSTNEKYLSLLLANEVSQWRIQDFSEVGASPSGGVNTKFCQNFSKTAWNWKYSDPQKGGGGGCVLIPTLDPPMCLSISSHCVHGHGSSPPPC